MKRLSFIFLMAVAIFFAACQKDDALQGTKEDAWKYDVTLPVPIQFRSSSNPLTKAVVEDISSITGPNGYLGILGVDHTLQDGRWGVDQEGSILFEDIRGTIVDYAARAKATANSIDFIDGNGEFGFKRFYPLYSNNNYTFYGYYPYVAPGDQGAKLGSDGYQVEYELGATDILWAKAQADRFANLDGYNARYIRKINESGKDVYDAKKPNLKFDHLLTALEFTIVSEEDSPVNNVLITGIKVPNTYSRATLVVADYDSPEESGRFILNKDDAKGVELTMDKPLESDQKGYIADPDGELLGTMMLIPQPTAYSNPLIGADGDSSTFYALVYATDATSGYETEYPTPFKIPITDIKAGIRYKITLTVRDLEKMDMSVTLNTWNDIEVDSGDGNLTLGNDDQGGTVWFEQDNITVPAASIETPMEVGVYSGSTGVTWKAAVATVGDSPVREGDPSWLRLVDDAGGRNNSLSFTALENTTDKPRTAVITVTYTVPGKQAKTVSLTVAQEAPKIAAKNNDVSFANADAVGPIVLDLTANYANPGFTKTITEGADWIDGDTTLMTGDDASGWKLSVNASEPNSTGLSQTGKITIQGRLGDPITIDVTRPADSTP